MREGEGVKRNDACTDKWPNGKMGFTYQRTPGYVRLSWHWDMHSKADLRLAYIMNPQPVDSQWIKAMQSWHLIPPPSPPALSDLFLSFFRFSPLVFSSCLSSVFCGAKLISFLTLGETAGSILQQIELANWPKFFKVCLHLRLRYCAWQLSYEKPHRIIIPLRMWYGSMWGISVVAHVGNNNFSTMCAMHQLS